MNELIHKVLPLVVGCVIALLTIHAVAFLIRIVTQVREFVPEIIELFITVVVGYICIHAYYEETMAGVASQNWSDRPFPLVIAFVGFGLCSASLLIVSKPPRRRR